MSALLPGALTNNNLSSSIKSNSRSGDINGYSCDPPTVCAGCGRTGLPLLVCDDCNTSSTNSGVSPNDWNQRFCAQCMIGKKVRVFWPLDEQWYVGVVQKYDHKTGEHQLTYPDGDTEWVKIGDTPSNVAAREREQKQQAERERALAKRTKSSNNMAPPSTSNQVSDHRQGSPQSRSMHYAGSQQYGMHQHQNQGNFGNIGQQFDRNEHGVSSSPDKNGNQPQHGNRYGNGGSYGTHQQASPSNESSTPRGAPPSSYFGQGPVQDWHGNMVNSQVNPPQSINTNGSDPTHNNNNDNSTSTHTSMPITPQPYQVQGTSPAGRTYGNIQISHHHGYGPHPGQPPQTSYPYPHPSYLIPRGYGYPPHPHAMSGNGMGPGTPMNDLSNINVPPSSDRGKTNDDAINSSGKRKSGPKTWTKEEDAILLSMVQNMRMPMKWSIVAQSMPDRTGKQCRERYVNHLNPRLKSSEWSPNEDATIFHLYNSVGSQWAKMSKMIPGRTDNGIKNRFHNLRRQLEREDEHRLRLSKPKDFPEDIRVERIRDGLPASLSGKCDVLWDMHKGIGILAAQSVMGGQSSGSGITRNAGKYGPFRMAKKEGEQCARCGLFAPSVQCGLEICERTKWCQTCTRIPPHVSGNLLRECVNLRRSQYTTMAKIIESWNDGESNAAMPAVDAIAAEVDHDKSVAAS